MRLPLIYNWRNILVRKLSTGLTFLVVAVVVGTLAILLAYVDGIKATLKVSGWPQNVLVLKPGATAESTSIIRLFEAARVVQTPGVALNAAGIQLISNELCAQTNITRQGTAGKPANVAVRGVDDVAFDVHPEIRMVEGRRFEQGSLECVVGRRAAERFAGLEIGGEVFMGRSGNRGFKVVGHYEAGGGALESEILAPRTMVTDVFGRNLVSSIFVRLEDASLVPGAVRYIESAAVQLDARPEQEYYAELSARTVGIFQLISGLVIIMAIGACFGVANTMYSAVDSRRREIAMLRTIGFSRAAVVLSFVTESLMICVAACIAGLACSMMVNGRREDALSDTTWTVLAYELRVTPTVALTTVAAGLLVAILGSVAPALRASRIQVIAALRKV